MKFRMLLTGSLLAILLFWACRNDPSVAAGQVEQTTEASPARLRANVPRMQFDPLCPALITPVQLEGVATTLKLSDYFTDVAAIDSIAVPQGLALERSANRSELSVRIVGDIGSLSVLSFFAGESRYDALLKRPNKRKVTLRLRDQGYREVALKGEMNSWNPADGQMKLNNGIWERTFEIMPGDYQYLFVVDGRELRDPKNPKTAPNGMGGTNSLLSLPKPDPLRLPSLYTNRFEGKAIEIGIPTAGKLIAFWENRQLEVTYHGNFGTVEIPDEAAELHRSYVRAYAQNEFGLSNDLLIPLDNGRVLDRPSQLSRLDPQAQIMYFVLIDRFNNGNPDNDDPLEDSRVSPLANYQGGDLAGITAKIRDGYFRSMNINSIWLSPITQNPSEAYQEYPEPRRWYSGYHGYWPVSSSRVDHRFGTERELIELVETAHEHGISLLLDYVCNHVHELHPIYREHPEWATRLDLPDGRKNLRLWDEERLTTWFDSFMPTLDLEDPQVVEVQSDSALYWVEKYYLDGYRHDATKHIPIEFWGELTRKLRSEVVLGQDRPVYQIGETYGGRELIASYIGTGLLDAQFDFPLYFDAREAFARPQSSFEALANSLLESFRYFGYHSSMGYISGNHDQPRFISLAGGDLSFDEDTREAGFARQVGVGDPVGYRRLQMLQAFNFCIPGVPVIYYGDEIGLPGAGDPDNRRMMRFDGWSEAEAQTKEIVEKLTELRRNRLSLIYGDTEILHVNDQTLAIARSYFGELTVVVFNKGGEEQTVRLHLPERFLGQDLRAQFGASLEGSYKEWSVTLPPYSFELLTN